MHPDPGGPHPVDHGRAERPGRPLQAHPVGEQAGDVAADGLVLGARGGRRGGGVRTAGRLAEHEDLLVRQRRPGGGAGEVGVEDDGERHAEIDHRAHPGHLGAQHRPDRPRRRGDHEHVGAQRARQQRGHRREPGGHGVDVPRLGGGAQAPPRHHGAGVGEGVELEPVGGAGQPAGDEPQVPALARQGREQRVRRARAAAAVRERDACAGADQAGEDAAVERHDRSFAREGSGSSGRPRSLTCAQRFPAPRGR